MNTLNYKVLLTYEDRRLGSIRKLMAAFIVILFISGLTTIPIDAELSVLLKLFSPGSLLFQWLQKVLLAYRQVNEHSRFLLYGYDWLVFAHFILVILFIGPYKDPIQNIWVIEFGLIACLLIIPVAFTAGYFRNIPIGWRLIDCSFGIFGFILLWICYRKTKILLSKTEL